MSWFGNSQCNKQIKQPISLTNRFKTLIELLIWNCWVGWCVCVSLSILWKKFGRAITSSISFALKFVLLIGNPPCPPTHPWLDFQLHEQSALYDHPGLPSEAAPLASWVTISHMTPGKLQFLATHCLDWTALDSTHSSRQTRASDGCWVGNKFYLCWGRNLYYPFNYRTWLVNMLIFTL